MPVAQLSVKPCGGVSLTRIRPLGFAVDCAPAVPPPTGEGGGAKGLSVDLSDASRSGQGVRASRGSKGLSRQAKSKLVFAVSYLERKYTKRALTFWTATVPTNDPNKLREILEKNKAILKYLRNQLVKYLATLGLPTEVVLVAELQSRGALHFHAVFVGRLYSAKIDRHELDALWERVLRANVMLPPDLTFDYACKCEPIRKSVGRYLAKYLSKSISKENKITKNLSITWYSIGTMLTQLYYNMLEQGKFPFSCSSSLFTYLSGFLEKILVCGKLVTRQDLLIGVRGFMESQQKFVATLLENPTCCRLFGEFLLSLPTT